MCSSLLTSVLPTTLLIAMLAQFQLPKILLVLVQSLHPLAQPIVLALGALGARRLPPLIGCRDGPNPVPLVPFASVLCQSYLKAFNNVEKFINNSGCLLTVLIDGYTKR